MPMTKVKGSWICGWVQRLLPVSAHDKFISHVKKKLLALFSAAAYSSLPVEDFRDRIIIILIKFESKNDTNCDNWTVSAVDCVCWCYYL